MQPKVEDSEAISEQSYVINENTQISWKFSGFEKPVVTWYFNGQLLETNDRIQITEDDNGRSTLTILNAQLVDRGVYIAQAENSVGKTEAKTTLSTAGIVPAIVTDLQGQSKVPKGHMFELKIIVSGTPEPKLVWMRDGKELVIHDRLHRLSRLSEVGKVYKLRIMNAQFEDQGKYSAKIQNTAGSLQSKVCDVSVTGKRFIFLFLL